MTISQEKLDDLLAGLPRYEDGTIASAANVIRVPAPTLESILTELKALRAQEPVAWVGGEREIMLNWLGRFAKTQHVDDKMRLERLVSLFASPTLSTVSPAVTDAAIDAALDATVPGGCNVLSYIDFSPDDAREIGVLPADAQNFSVLDIVRIEQWRDCARAIIRAAVTAALQPGGK